MGAAAAVVVEPRRITLFMDPLGAVAGIAALATAYLLSFDLAEFMDRAVFAHRGGTKRVHINVSFGS